MRGFVLTCCLALLTAPAFSSPDPDTARHDAAIAERLLLVSLHWLMRLYDLAGELRIEGYGFTRDGAAETSFRVDRYRCAAQCLPDAGQTLSLFPGGFEIQPPEYPDTTAGSTVE